MKKFSLFILFSIFLTANNLVWAQSMPARVYFQGPAVDIAPQSEFLVSVFLDATEPVNAFDLEIAYPADKFKFLSFDNTNSVVSLWQSSPVLLPKGNIRLSGGILQSFSGSGGLLVKISFRALNPEDAKLSFVKSNLYLADGKGTEIKATPVSSIFTVAEDGEIISTPTAPFQSTPTDVLIQKELESFKSEMQWANIFALFPLMIFLVLVFYIVKVYNNRKRKL